MFLNSKKLNNYYILFLPACGCALTNAGLSMHGSLPPNRRPFYILRADSITYKKFTRKKKVRLCPNGFLLVIRNFELEPILYK